METFTMERFIKNAEEAFDRNEYLEGMAILEEALAIEPDYSKAHNHLGWAYLYQVKNIEKAESHLSYALKCKYVYGAAYMHMAHILFDKRDFQELEKLLNKAMSHSDVERAFIYNEFGRMKETQGRFRKAIGFYKKAACNTFDDKELMTIKENIHRCRYKRWIIFT